MSDPLFNPNYRQAVLDLCLKVGRARGADIDLILSLIGLKCPHCGVKQERMDGPDIQWQQASTFVVTSRCRKCGRGWESSPESIMRGEEHDNARGT